MIEIPMAKFLEMLFSDEVQRMDLWWGEEGATGVSTGRLGLLNGKIIQVSGFRLEAVASALAARLGGKVVDGTIDIPISSWNLHRGSPEFYRLLDPETSLERFRSGSLGRVGPFQITCSEVLSGGSRLSEMALN